LYQVRIADRGGLDDLLLQKIWGSEVIENLGYECGKLRGFYATHWIAKTHLDLDWKLLLFLYAKSLKSSTQVLNFYCQMNKKRIFGEIISNMFCFL
jgi:hypothetical protein